MALISKCFLQILTYSFMVSDFSKNHHFLFILVRTIAINLLKICLKLGRNQSSGFKISCKKRSF